MRTTLTLDDDVAMALERRRVGRGTRLRDEVNELLRIGLAAADQPPEGQEPFALPTFDPGRALITDIHSLGELLDDEDVERALSVRA